MLLMKKGGRDLISLGRVFKTLSQDFISWAQVSESLIKDSKSQVNDFVSLAKDSKSWGKDFISWAWVSESLIKDSKSRVKDFVSLAKDSKSWGKDFFSLSRFPQLDIVLKKQYICEATPDANKLNQNAMRKKFLPFVFSFIIYNSSSIISHAQTTIAGAGNHSLAVCTTYVAKSWGRNSAGQLGNGSMVNSNVPVSVSLLTGAVRIAGGSGHSLALKNDGTVWAWGDNNYGQLGNGTTISSTIPVQVSGLSGVIGIEGGLEHSIAVKSDGSVWTWGRNNYGQLGNGTTINSNIPLLVGGLTGMTIVAAGEHHSIALKNDGTVRTWGKNLFGQLGNGTTTDSNVPVTVSSLTSVTAIAGGDVHSLAVRNDGTVRAWGYNFDGQLGDGTGFDSNVPVTVSTITGITAVSGGYGHSLALKNDGTVWSWGYNFDGELGIGTSGPFTNSLAPVSVSTLTGVIAISAGALHSLILKSDGTMRAWGYNFDGALGNGTNTDSNVPVMVIALCPVSNSINEIAEEGTLSVYPNPSNGIFNVESTEKILAVEIYNVLGAKVYHQQIANASNLQIDLSSHAKGVYFIKVQSEKEVLTQKIVIE
jgi:alpha-tubulin suppressor-like RCC1 family protein